jgi:hypothetical protein
MRSSLFIVDFLNMPQRAGLWRVDLFSAERPLIRVSPAAVDVFAPCGR